LSAETALILIAVGILAGFLSGLFGVGGGIVIVPSLFAVYAFTGFDSPYLVHIAIATSLFTIIFTSLSSSHKHFTHGNVEWGAALIIGLSSTVTVFLFSKIAIALPGDVLKKIFSIVLIIVAVRMLLDKKGKDEAKKGNDKLIYNKWICMIIGILSGAIAAFSGLGGGVFVIPLMHYLLNFPIKKSIGTSSAAILLTAVSGVISYYSNAPEGANTLPYSFGMVDTLSALPVIAVSIPFARVGVFVNKKTHHYLLSKLFAVFVLLVSLKILFF
jgi:uncharacterized membrane protein YfcA